MDNPYDAIDPPTTVTPPPAGANPYDVIHPPTFGTTPGGAAIFSPRTQPRNLSGSNVISDIGGATVFGGAAGLVAPEIIQGTGRLIKAIPTPQTQAIGGGLEYLGTAARLAGPAARVASGALGGAGSEVLGKTAETLGAGPVTAEAARFVGGGLSPEIARVVGTSLANVLTHYVMPGRLDAAALRELAGRVSRGVRSMTGQDLTEQEQAYISNLISDVHGSQKPGEALANIGKTLQAGAEDVLQSGETTAARMQISATNKARLSQQFETGIAERRLRTQQAEAAKLHTVARDVLNESETAARAEVDAVAQGKSATQDAESYIAALKNNVTDAARASRAAIGNERDTTTIGTGLRDLAVKRENDFRTAASERYAATAADVNAGVAKLEAGGLNVASLPAYKDLVSYLQKQIKLGERAPEVAAGFKKILDQITVKAEEGAPAIAPSFRALDDARRLMGESFRGLPAEGYGAIDEVARKNIYGKLRDIQVNFAGPKQAQLLTDYADSRPELAQFGSAAGKKMTGLDRGSLSQFANNPENIPAYFFKTPTSFQQLVDLVGDKAVATQAGLDYIATELATKDTSAKVRTWLGSKSNRDMFNAVPGAKEAVSKYATTLENAERHGATLDTALARAKTRAGELRAGGTLQSNELANQAGAITTAAETENVNALKKAAGEAEQIITDAKLAAGEVSDASKAAADKIWNRKNVSGQLNARQLITAGNAAQWELVAPIIQRSPEAKRAVYDALRETVADRLSKGAIKGSSQWFNETVSPAMVKFGMIDETQVKELAKSLAAVEAQRIPSKESLGVWNRMLLQSVAGYSSSVGARGARAGFSLLPDIPNEAAPERRNQLAPERP